jgi:hypothetical protein
MTILSTIAWAIGFCFFALALVVFFGIVEKTSHSFGTAALSLLSAFSPGSAPHPSAKGTKMPTQNEFTEEQANDLARHFLGSQWVAHRFADGRCALAAIEPDVHYFSGPNWRTAFREAGVKLPFPKALRQRRPPRPAGG